MTTLRIVRYVAWGAVAVLLVAFGLIALQWQEEAKVERVAAASVGGPFTLIDQNGATVTEAAFDGHPTALFFGYTFCPEVCPTTLFEMTAWLAELGSDAERLKVFFVTVDPQRDTKEMLAEYVSAFDPRITALTGSPEAIAEMTKAYRIFARKVPLDDGDYIMEHTASIYLLDSNAVFTGTIDYSEDPDIALAKLRRLVDAS